MVHQINTQSLTLLSQIVDKKSFTKKVNDKKKLSLNNYNLDNLLKSLQKDSKKKDDSIIIDEPREEQNKDIKSQVAKTGKLVS